jgi:hypothetical protein
VAAGLVGLLAVAPRQARAVAATFTVYAGADVLQLGYSRLQDAG